MKVAASIIVVSLTVQSTTDLNHAPLGMEPAISSDIRSHLCTGMAPYKVFSEYVSLS